MRGKERNKVLRSPSSGLGHDPIFSIVPNIYSSLTKEAQFQPSQSQREAPTNRITSTRFNLLTFIPVALFLQYKKVVVCVYTFNVLL